MYALVMLEVVVGMTVLDACLRRPSLAGAVPVGVVTALLLYTHYWAIYLIAAVGVVLLVAARRPGPPRTALLAVAGGVVLWLPWVPTFLFQSDRTATPWAEPARPASVAAVFDAGGSGPLPIVLSVAMAALVLLGVWRGDRLLRRPSSARGLGLVLALTLLGALAGAMFSDSAYASRYTSVAVPLMIVLAAIGASTLRPAWSATVLALVGVVGLVPGRCGGGDGPDAIGGVRRTAARPGPLGRRARLLPGPARPGGVSACSSRAGSTTCVRSCSRRDVIADRVDWIDYEDRHRAADAAVVRRRPRRRRSRTRRSGSSSAGRTRRPQRRLSGAVRRVDAGPAPVASC